MKRRFTVRLARARTAGKPWVAGASGGLLWNDGTCLLFLFSDLVCRRRPLDDAGSYEEQGPWKRQRQGPYVDPALLCPLCSNIAKVPAPPVSPILVGRGSSVLIWREHAFLVTLLLECRGHLVLLHYVLRRVHPAGPDGVRSFSPVFRGTCVCEGSLPSRPLMRDDPWL